MTPQHPISSSLREPRPIVVVSPNPRSGTNWVSNTLRSHPDCTGFSTPSLTEDFFIRDSHLLRRYVEGLPRYGYGWARAADAWENERYGMLSGDELLGARKGALMAQIGSALLRFGRPRKTGAQFVVMKQTRLAGLEYARELWPEAKAIVLVRDGRDVMESIRRTWQDEPFNEGLKEVHFWRDGVRTIREWMQCPPLPLLVVKYEQLVAEPQRKFRQMFRFLGLEVTAQFLDSVGQLVHGSSDTRVKEGTMDFSARPMTADFNPLERAANWSQQAQDEFLEDAGAELKWLGYPVS